MRRGLIVLALLGALALAGCGSNAELAKDAQEQGRSCDAATLAPHNSTYASECAHEKHDEEVESEAHEAEKVIKQRHAEELANAAEGR